MCLFFSITYFPVTNKQICIKFARFDAYTRILFENRFCYPQVLLYERYVYGIWCTFERNITGWNLIRVKFSSLSLKLNRFIVNTYAGMRSKLMCNEQQQKIACLRLEESIQTRRFRFTCLSSFRLMRGYSQGIRCMCMNGWNEEDNFPDPLSSNWSI